MVFSFPCIMEKGANELCADFRGFPLLSSAGKTLLGIVILRLNTSIWDNIFPVSPCGFEPNRGTIDTVFAVRQLHEMSDEQRQGLSQVSRKSRVDLVGQTTFKGSSVFSQRDKVIS